MKLLKSRIAWKRWVKAEIEPVGFSVEEPKEYPCFAYSIVASFGYEELQPVYLYRHDIEKMLTDLSRCRINSGWDSAQSRKR